MLRSKLLSRVRPFYDAEKEEGSDKVEKTDAEKQRKNIKVTNSGDNSEKKEDKKDVEDKVDEKDESEKKEEDDAEEGEEDDDEEKNETKELSAEQKEIEALKKKVSRLEKRTGRTAGERDQFKKDLAAAKTQLEAKVADGQGLSEEEVERRAEIKANEKVTQREFERAVSKLTSDAVKIDKDFMTKINEVALEVAPIPPFMIGALEDLDNGGAVLAHLADTPDEYEEILNLTPAKMVSRLTKISNKILEDVKEKPKKISKVPDPPEKMKGGNSSPGILTGKESMDEFVRIRNQQTEDRRKARLR